MTHELIEEQTDHTREARERERIKAVLALSGSVTSVILPWKNNIISGMVYM